jgi:hypothetical protein
MNPLNILFCSTKQQNNTVKNPGPYDTSFQEVRRVLELPTCGSTLQLEVGHDVEGTKSEGSPEGLAVTHRAVWGNTHGHQVPFEPYYRISGRYKYNRNYIWSAYRTTGEYDLRVARDWSSYLSTVVKAQMDRPKDVATYKYQADANIKLSTATISLKAANWGLAVPKSKDQAKGRKPLLSLSALAALTSEWAVGGEAMYQKQDFNKKNILNHSASFLDKYPLHTTVSLRHDNGDHLAIGSISGTTDSLSLGFFKKFFVCGHYLQRVNKNVSLASEYVADVTTGYSIFKLGCEFALPRAKSTVRSTVNQSGIVCTSMETSISPSSTLTFTAELDYNKDIHNFGLRLSSGNVLKQKYAWTPQQMMKSYTLRRGGEGLYDQEGVVY